MHFPSLLLLLGLGVGCAGDELASTSPSDRSATRTRTATPYGKPVPVVDDSPLSGRIAAPAAGTSSQIVYSEDFESGAGGWIAKDLSVEPQTFWHQTEYAGLGVMWCGTDDPCVVASAGYGNLWDQRLSKSFGPRDPNAQIDALIVTVQNLPIDKKNLNGLVSKLNEAEKKYLQGNLGAAANSLQDFIDQVNAKVNNGVLTEAQGALLVGSAQAISNPTLGFVVQFDTEPDYDSVLVQMSPDGGTTFSTLESLNGSSGGFVSRQVALPAFLQASDLVVRFRFLSDFSFSDADGNFDSNGACRLDEVHLSGVPTDDFETGPQGWAASVGPAAGGGPFRLETDLAGWGDGVNHAWAAYDLSGPHAGMFPVAPANDPARGINLGIESPAISIPADATSITLEFDVFRDLPFANLVFYQYEIAGPCHFRQPTLIYFGPDGPQWKHSTFDVTGLVPPGATEIRIRLIAFEYVDFGQKTTHTSSPFFDNVKVTVTTPDL